MVTVLKYQRDWVRVRKRDRRRGLPSLLPRFRLAFYHLFFNPHPISLIFQDFIYQFNIISTNEGNAVNNHFTHTHCELSNSARMPEKYRLLWNLEDRRHAFLFQFLAVEIFLQYKSSLTHLLGRRIYRRTNSRYFYERKSTFAKCRL